MKGCVAAMVYVSLWYIGKAVLEAAYFKDRIEAKRTLFLWTVSFGSISLALAFSLLFYYLS